MSSERLLKRAVFGGFERESALNYIESLQKEILLLKRNAEDSEARRKEIKKLHASGERAESDMEALRLENEALKAENAALKEKSAAIVSEVENVRDGSSDYKDARRNWEKKIEALEIRIDELERSRSKIEEANEKLGGTISEAVEYAERVKSAARDFAKDMIAKASRAVGSAKEETESAKDGIKAARENFDASASFLETGVEILAGALDKISLEIDGFDAEDV